MNKENEDKNKKSKEHQQPCTVESIPANKDRKTGTIARMILEKKV